MVKIKDAAATINSILDSKEKDFVFSLKEIKSLVMMDMTDEALRMLEDEINKYERK